MTHLGVNVEDFGKFAKAARDADKSVQKAVRKGFRDAAKPLGEDVVREGSQQMPARGGLRDRLSKGKIGIAASFGKNPKVTVKLGTRAGYQLSSLDSGTLRHPIFARQGRKRRWTAQHVPSGTYSEAFQRGAPKVRERVLREMQRALDDIAREV